MAPRCAFEFLDEYELDAVATGDPAQHCQRVGRHFGVVSQRDDASVLGAKAVVVNLEGAPRRNRTDDLRWRRLRRVFTPFRLRAAPRVQTAVARVERRRVLGCRFEYAAALVNRPLEAQAVPSRAVAPGSVCAREPGPAIRGDRPQLVT